jgi:hypothetical protein
VRGLLLLVERERHGEAVDRQLIASLLRMLKDLGLYSDRFEAPFLAETAAFYKAEGGTKVAECDTAAYLEHCEVGLALVGLVLLGFGGGVWQGASGWLWRWGRGLQAATQPLALRVLASPPRAADPPLCRRPLLSHPPQTRLQQEHERAAHYLDVATRRPLVAEAERQLVSAHLPTLLAKASFAALVDAQVGGVLTAGWGGGWGWAKHLGCGRFRRADESGGRAAVACWPLGPSFARDAPSFP